MDSTFLKQLHDKSLGNRADLAAGGQCGCFHCLRTFPSVAIAQYLEKEGTALCPHCGVDSILAERSLPCPLSLDLLRVMREEFFL